MTSFRFTYATEAFPATCAFWEELVGLRCIERRALGADPDDDRVALFEAGGGAIEIIEAASVVPGEGSWIQIEVNDVDELFERLRANGVTIRYAPTARSGERSCYVSEPNGLGVVFFTTL